MEIARNDAEHQLINAVVDAPSAWETPLQLALALGWTLEATLDVIADLDAAGWLDAWELAEGPVVTLSVAASNRLGVRLVEVGADETPRWARAGDLEPAGRRAAAVFRSERMAGLDLVADDRPSAEEALIRQEEAEQDALTPRAGGRSNRAEMPVPRPTLLVGTGLTPWPGPAEVAGSTCPACQSVPLPSHAYCLRCDRSGRDADPAEPVVTATSDQLDPTRSVPRGETAPRVGSRRERERQRRRDKRKRRRVAQVKLGRPASRLVVPLWMSPVAG